MKFHVGTSGYSYKEWKGSFYPPKIKADEMLRFYAERFSTVEINNTFYRMPKTVVVESWAEQAPEGFRFVLKASKRITHIKRLKEAEEPTEFLLKAAAVLGDKQGPLLFQLPPNLKKDLPRLETFLAHIKNRAKVAMEFRNATWFDDEVFACLRSHASSLCLSEADDMPKVPLVNTADFGYLRLRSEGYTDEELSEWIKKIRDQGWKDCYVFFKHEDAGTGPALANRMLELIG